MHTGPQPAMPTVPQPLMPTRILTPSQVRALDLRTIAELGLPAALLMDTAGRAIAHVIVDRIASCTDRPRHAVVLCGSGNNGGDGFVAARILHGHGFTVEVVAAGDRGRMSPETSLHCAALGATGVGVRWLAHAPTTADLQDLRLSLDRAAAIVDALVGIGPETDLREPLRSLVALLDGSLRGLVVAADLPSGLSATDGRVLGAAVKAHVVVTMAAAKAGLFLGQGPEHWQELVVADIGVPRAWLQAQVPCGWLLDEALARTLLPSRPESGHKGRFGHLLLVAGSAGKAGAALLAAEAALRSGTGLCTLATSSAIRPQFEGQLPDLMTESTPGDAAGVDSLLSRKSAIAVGPGLGTAAAEAELVQRIAEGSTGPLLLDADALTLLAAAPDLAKAAAGRLVMTPHPGEMARLLGRPVEACERDRLATAREAAARWQAVVVYKGQRTLVAAPDGAWAVQPTPNVALARGGTGDVLTGIAGALLAQGLSPFDAARLAVTVHAVAGARLRQSHGQRAGLALDLVRQLPGVWLALESPLAANESPAGEDPPAPFPGRRFRVQF